MDFPHGVTVTLRTVATADDGLGNTTATPTETSWGPCAVAPRYANESTDPRMPRVIVGKTVYGPTVTINSDDQLIIGGLVYEVDGEPGEWTNPFTGWAPGIEVPVKRAASV